MAESATQLRPPLPKSIYFGGCAFGSAFYIGVHRAMVELWGEDFHKQVHFSGGSAGTIFAIALALGKTPDSLDLMYRRIAIKANKHGHIHNASVFMEDELRLMLDEPHTYKKLDGRCCFGTTAFFSRHRWHVSWVDNEDVIATSNASLHIPFYCQRNTGVKGVWVVDGAYGFSGIDLPHGDETLYVGIDPHAEVTRTFTNAEMFYPATGQAYEDMVASGYRAMMEWNGKMNKKVGSRVPNYQALYVLWILKVLEEIAYGCYSFVRFILVWLFSIFTVWKGKKEVAAVESN